MLFAFAEFVVCSEIEQRVGNGFHVDDFGSALLFSIVLTVVNYLLEWPNKYLNRKELQEKQDDNTDDEGFTPYEEIES